MFALEENGYQEGVIGRVAVARIGIVVEVAVALADVVLMDPRHSRGKHMAAEDMDR